MAKNKSIMRQGKRGFREIPNPFSVQSPEDIPAKEAFDLFVPVFTDFPKVQGEGHTFIHGPRGSGKSMMFRYMKPDCQLLLHEGLLNTLPYFAAYVPAKDTDLKRTELFLFENDYAGYALNEHFMVTHVGIHVFDTLSSLPATAFSKDAVSQFQSFYKNEFLSFLNGGGWHGELPSLNDTTTPVECCKAMREVLQGIYTAVINYLDDKVLRKSSEPYRGALFGYLRSLLPLLRAIGEMKFMPGLPIYLLIDDADNLSEMQTKILNSWVSARKSSLVSLKISTQQDYKTYLTLNGLRISAPHDYSGIDISSVYTSSKNKYLQRIEKIVQKRLDLAGIRSTTKAFFPPDARQEAAIARIADEIRANPKRGYRISDDVTRYARPEYIRRRVGKSKSGHTYSYAGFEQLVHISSGIVRNFLEGASLMWSKQIARYPAKPPNHIRPDIQSEVVRSLGDNFLFVDLVEFAKDERDPSVIPSKNLRNLIDALGGAFKTILISDASERRVFSVAFSQEPADDVLAVFRLGVKYGFFQEATIGNKEGTGRTLLFIMNRRLAPVYLLDPTSFAGYKFLTNEALREAMSNPKTFISKFKNGKYEKNVNVAQQMLFAEV
jgi:hypothetical protein